LGVTNEAVTMEETVWAKNRTTFEEDEFLLKLKA
jgi:hypothetical protein